MHGKTTIKNVSASFRLFKDRLLNAKVQHLPNTCNFFSVEVVEPDEKQIILNMCFIYLFVYLFIYVHIVTR
jgi:hypothetical protein